MGIEKATGVPVHGTPSHVISLRPFASSLGDRRTRDLI